MPGYHVDFIRGRQELEDRKDSKVGWGEIQDAP
jgi:hypothetical protein